ncbi:MAG TPA: response regulator [Gemmatimonadaceae bacterium]|nr:response regulator [Gemmatimonadaceae bacterium]
MKFLVVDDSLTMRRIIINALERIGYTDAIEASDGHEALGRFDASIGFIITDWNMPTMSGLDFARAVRATPCGQSVPILMVTTRGAREDIVAAVDAGVNNYILKPFTPLVLKEKIDRLLASLGAAA